MRDLNELKKEFEDERLFWALRNIEEECASIYLELNLDTNPAMNCLKFLIISSNKEHWLEVIDWATTLAQNVRKDLQDNNFSLNTMNTLMSNLLELINIATKKQCRELRGKI